MKKVVILFLIVTFILGITGCNNKNLSNASSSLENNIQNGEVLNQTEEKNWSESKYYRYVFQYLQKKNGYMRNVL